MAHSTYELSASTLKVRGDLSFPLEIQFDIETRALVDGARKRDLREATIDLRQVTAMASQYIGALAAVAAELRAGNCSLTVRASGNVGDTIRQCGLDRLMALIIE